MLGEIDAAFMMEAENTEPTKLSPAINSESLSELMIMHWEVRKDRGFSSRYARCLD